MNGDLVVEGHEIKVVAAAKRVRKRAAQGLSSSEMATLKRLLASVQQNLKTAQTAKEAG